MSQESIFYELKTLLSIEPELRRPGDLTSIQSILLNFRFFQQIQRDYHINNLVDCAIYFKYLHYLPGEFIFSVSQPASKFFLLLKGEVSIYKHNQLIRKYNEGPFEECCLVERRKHDTSAVTSSESHILYIDYLIYSGLLANFREKRRVAMASFLRVQQEFKSWTIANLMGLSYFIHEVFVEEGEMIFNIGDPSDGIYIVQDGSVVLKDKEIKMMKAGDIIGLDDISKNFCRKSKCISQAKSTLLYIFKHDYIEKKNNCMKPKLTLMGIHRKIEKKSAYGLSIYSFVPEDNKPIKLINITRPTTGISIRPSSQISQRSQIRLSLTSRAHSTLKARSQNHVRFH